MMSGNDFRLYPRDSDVLHYGVGHEHGGHSGRYPWGSGERPKQRYGNTVFVSGSSKTQDKSSSYYRRKLPRTVRKKIDEKIQNGDKIIVGDAPGIDRQVQDYLKKKKYDNVEIYGPGKEVRYLANKDWKVNMIDDPDHEPMSPEWLAKKDKAMSDAADEALAIILDEGANATRNNIQRALESGKTVDVYSLSSVEKKFDKWLSDEEYKENEHNRRRQEIEKENSLAMQKLEEKASNKSISQEELDREFFIISRNYDAKIDQLYFDENGYKNGNISWFEDRIGMAEAAVKDIDKWLEWSDRLNKNDPPTYDVYKRKGKSYREIKDEEKELLDLYTYDKNEIEFKKERKKALEKDIKEMKDGIKHLQKFYDKVRSMHKNGKSYDDIAWELNIAPYLVDAIINKYEK